MVVRHTVHTRDERYRVPSYERGSGSRVERLREDHSGVADLFVRGGPSTELSSELRRELALRFPSAFAIHEGEPSEYKYPVPTVRELEEIGAPRPRVSGPRHALNALQRVKADGTMYERAMVHAQVRERYPRVWREYKENER